MKNLRVFLAVCLLGAALGACGESSPTATSVEGSRLDNGSGFGSGHDSDSTLVVAGTDTTTAASSLTGATAAGGLTIRRNGSGFGSGN